MSEKITATTGRFYWHELAVSDVAKARGFYGELFGWQARDMDMGPNGTYTVLSVNGKDIAGMTTLAKGGPGWLAYVTAQDVDAATARAKEAGATIEVPPSDIPGIGRFSIFTDAQGARVAPFKPTEESPVADKPELGTFCWNELLTQDPASAVKLYTKTFEWKTEEKDMGPMGTYTILKRGDRQAAGLMKAMDPKAPSAWLPYVAVEDVDRSFEKATKLKAQGIVPPSDIPGVGRFAVVVDPQGAMIALFKG